MASSATTVQSRITPEAALAIWHGYRKTRDRRLRDRLVLTYAPLVRYIVFRKFRELPARCEADDFISCGLEAVIAALDRYDPAKGATLDQFVWTRVHGAVLDELRRQDWAPRSVRRWGRDITRARHEFIANHGRPPTGQELADLLGVDPDELRRRTDELVQSDVGSLNAPVLSDDETDVERIETLAGDERDDPERQAALREAKEKFRRAFQSLSARDREVAVMLYVNNLTLREIGDALGVSESRVCQIHTRLKRTLRERLSDDETLFQAVA